ncbi:MAG: permease prefix domain 1-containing protein [Lachnospiraceae bacterium]|nr:permease prefix domain 1-containing protein [Lachnospiraceae bacterium]
MGFNICEAGCIKEFLGIVQEQICYKPVRKEACKELEEHLEDKAEEYIKSGMSEEMAVIQAVKEMGDPTAVGVKLNESYSLQKDYKLPALILLAVFGGIVSNWVYGYEISYSFYFFFGMAVLFASAMYGYRFCAKHIRILTAAAIIYGTVWGSYSIIQGILKVNDMSGIEETLWLWNAHNGDFLSSVINKMFSMTIRFNAMFLVIPFCAVLLYRGRNKKVFGLAASGALIVAVTAGAVAYPPIEYLLSAVVIVIISYFGLSLATVGKDRKILIPVLVTLACSAFLVVGKGSELKVITELFLTPEKQAVSTWEDGYNGVLIKELLGAFFGYCRKR